MKLHITRRENGFALPTGKVCLGLTALFIATLCGAAKAEDAKSPDTTPAAVMTGTAAPATADNADAEKKKKAAADPTPAAPTPPSAPAKTASPLRGIFAFGADLYYGGTNVTGVHASNNDGMWAGYGTAYPSKFSLNWHEGDTRTATVSIGVGDLFNGPQTSFRQPVEAFYQLPAGHGGSLTVGKFYVPFASEEWEYETKYGLMYQTAHGAMNYAASLNYNTIQDTPNVYFRAGRMFGTKTSLGLSAGLGRGLFYNSSHGAALGVDLMHDFGGVQFTGEYNLAAGAHGPFQFLYGKLTLTKAGNLTPFVGAYYWHDSAQELGAFNSLVGGLDYRLTQHLTLEGGYARAKSRDIVWIQSHVNF